jgi:NAD(P)-dependent dehydrogenase (short-subunit alcohol dehydrogenase family)
MDGTVVVTGGNSGIGLETAAALAGQGRDVVLAVRDLTKGESAAAEIGRRTGRTPTVMALDLASLASVRSFAAALHGQTDRLAVLVNNAGVYLAQRRTTEDGFESTFGVNHLGHFLLTAELRELLVASAPARVVTVSSTGHRSGGPLDFDDLMMERDYRGWTAYCHSKLANILFTRELARRLAGTGVTANSVHPGFVGSGFARDGDTRLLAIGMVLSKPFSLSPKRGARTSVYLASSSDVEGVTGQYFARCKPKQPAPSALDDAAAARLWDVSVKLTGAPDPA